MFEIQVQASQDLYMCLLLGAQRSGYLWFKGLWFK